MNGCMDGQMDGETDGQPGGQAFVGMNIIDLYNLNFKYGLYFLKLDGKEFTRSGNNTFTEKRKLV